jgi:glucose/arabinose dehydrogenase
MPQRSVLVGYAIAPDYSLNSHVAPLGLAMSSGTDLPDNYRGGAFVSEHGSWGRMPLDGNKAVFRAVQRRKAEWPGAGCRSGFLDANQRARGQPVCLAMDRSGTLLIVDDV